MQSQSQQEARFDSTISTIVVMEGLTMYLEEDTVRGLFDQIASMTPPSSQVVFDHFGFRNGRLDCGWMTTLQEKVVGSVGEAWKWGIDPTDLSEFFASTQW
eukprot:CAMPEP_0116542590 /NCGR_PEP_ID=MMETSP0397-20121206/1098_1 /TAXON_ID=216820 /ORGANISM="Cyclophora tenuis, Strain ECT3854" /LENGTH=100 /DNA_ID=CAMNT_0004066611 /DNA_START=193 /DNA_END=492 /DNA_ORIENTATION=+